MARLSVLFTIALILGLQQTQVECKNTSSMEDTAVVKQSMYLNCLLLIFRINAFEIMFCLDDKSNKKLSTGIFYI